MRRLIPNALGRWTLGVLLAGYAIGWLRRDLLARRPR